MIKLVRQGLFSFTCLIMALSMLLVLQGKQFDLLEYLINSKDTIITKEQIFDKIWGFDSDTSTNVVEVYASGLRKVLKKCGYDKYIKTLRGVGYIFSSEE